MSEENIQYITLNNTLSWVWNHFKVFKKLDESNNKYAECQKCEKDSPNRICAYHSTPTNLKDHMELYHNLIFQQEILKEKQTKNSQRTIQQFFPQKIDKKETIFQICLMIIRDVLPISTVEQIGFRDLIQKLDNTFLMPSRQTIKKYMDQIFQISKREVQQQITQQILSRDSHFSIILDSWQSVNIEKFIGVQITFVNKDWSIQNIHLSLYPMTDNSPQNLIKDLENVLQSYKLIEKYLKEKQNRITFVMDAETTNKQQFKEYSNIICYCHVINNSFKSLITIPKNEEKYIKKNMQSHFTTKQQFTQIFQKCKQISSYFRMSAVKKDQLKRQFDLIELNNYNLKLQELKEKNDANGIEKLSVKPFKKIRGYQETRWLSIYLVIESLIYHKEAIQFIFNSTLTSKDQLFDSQLNVQEWEVLEDMAKIGDLLNQIVAKLQFRNEVTISYVIPSMNFITSWNNKTFLTHHKIINQLSVSIIEQFIFELQKRYNKHLLIQENLYQIATYLDIRYRNNLLYLNQSQYQNTKIVIKDKILNMLKQEDSEFEEIELELNSFVMLKVNDIIIPNQKKISKEENIDKEFEVYERLALNTEQQPLEFWKQNQQNLPYLSTLAKSILSIPSGSYEVERTFSQAGNLISKKRNLLKKELVQMLLFLQINLNSLNIDKTLLEKQFLEQYKEIKNIL